MLTRLSVLWACTSVDASHKATASYNYTSQAFAALPKSRADPRGRSALPAPEQSDCRARGLIRGIWPVQALALGLQRAGRRRTAERCLLEGPADRCVLAQGQHLGRTGGKKYRTS